VKLLMVIIDGLADERIKELGFKTSLAYAKHENLDKIAAQGQQGLINTCPQGVQPESMSCILHLLGVKKEFYPNSRAALEVLAHGYSLKEHEIVLRCNLLAVDSQHRIVSFNGGGLTNQEMARAAELVTGIDPEIKFIHLSGYRNLMIVDKKLFNMLNLPHYPPHEYLHASVNELLAKLFAASERLRHFVYQGTAVLKDFGRSQLQYLFYPWGLAEKAKLPSFEQMYHTKGAVVGGAEIIKGIALALGMVVPNLEDITADIDTDLHTKARTACDLLQKYNFVLVHINGADEASHRCDFNQKVGFIERIDREFVSYLLDHTAEDTRILICADHATSPVQGNHTALEVPFFIRGAKGDPKVILPPSAEGQDVLRYLFKHSINRPLHVCVT
jgi:2,3-bisphosphoglycerate-independent phosphoglycerate mutase